MSCLSVGGKASLLAISSLQRSMVLFMLSVVYVTLPPCGPSIHSPCCFEQGGERKFLKYPKLSGGTI